MKYVMKPVLSLRSQPLGKIYIYTIKIIRFLFIYLHFCNKSHDLQGPIYLIENVIQQYCEILL